MVYVTRMFTDNIEMKMFNGEKKIGIHSCYIKEDRKVNGVKEKNNEKLIIFYYQ